MGRGSSGISANGGGNARFADAMSHADADAWDVLRMTPVNDVEPDKVQALADSIEKNGWQGMPILYSEDYGILITGSHRQAALQELDNRGFDLSSLGNVAANVDDLLIDWADRTGDGINDIQYDNLSAIFKGTWVAKYKKYIVEW